MNRLAHPTLRNNDTIAVGRTSHHEYHHHIFAQWVQNMSGQYSRPSGMRKAALREGDRMGEVC